MVKPILFNTEMVRAILDGRKTVTRRVVKPQPVYSKKSGFNWKGSAFGTDIPPTVKGAAYNFRCAAPYRTGDILWVRETWSQSKDGLFLYRAWPWEGQEPEKQDEAMRCLRLKWHPSIHMPREAARIWLRVTVVRVEQLQEIDGNGLRAEGFGIPCLPNEVEDQFDKYGATFDLAQAKRRFSALWDSTIKPADRDRYGWAANPWVWVIAFERCEKPEEV